MKRVVLALAAAGAFSAETAIAQDIVAPETSQIAIANNADLIIELGVGAKIQPRYEGADEYIVSPFPIISLDYLNIPGLLEIGGSDRVGGLSIGPSFRFIDERDPDDDPDLFGTRSLDRTYEVGLRVGYEIALDPVYGIELYGEGRYAFGEAEGFVGGLGIDAIARPTNRLELKLGPRTSFASSDYMDTYFSVTSAESLLSGGRLDAFEADAGFKTVGLLASARYEFRPNWFLNTEFGYDRLIGDAGDSPIVDAGSEDQFFAGFGLSRRFSFDLF